MTDNPRAFPGEASRFDGSVAGGMNLRDWFAGQILPVLASQQDGPAFEGMDYVKIAALFAKIAYIQADAMLAERRALP